MKWFLNISTKNKLFVGFSLIIVLLIAVLLTAYIGIADINANQKILLEAEFPISLELAKLRANMNRERTLMSRAVGTKESLVFEQLNKEIKEDAEDIKEKFQQLYAISSNAPQYSQSIREIEEMRNSYTAVWEKEIVPLLLKKDTGEAVKIYAALHREQYEKLREANLRLSLKSEEKDKELRAKADRIVMKLKNIFIGASIIAILAGIVMSIFLTVIIAEPLRKASAAAEQIAYGDLTAKLPSLDRSDEVGSLMLALGMMTESLRTMTSEIQSSVNMLTDSSSKILKGFEEGIKKEDGISQIKSNVQDLNSIGLKLKKLVEQYKI